MHRPTINSFRRSSLFRAFKGREELRIKSKNEKLENLLGLHFHEIVSPLRRMSGLMDEFEFASNSIPDKKARLRFERIRSELESLLAITKFSSLMFSSIIRDDWSRIRGELQSRFTSRTNSLSLLRKDNIMGTAIVKLNISTYAGEEYVVEVPCKKDDMDELIISRAWKKVKEEEGGSLPYGNRYAEILKRKT